jgi:hypothetical protein
MFDPGSVAASQPNPTTTTAMENLLSTGRVAGAA